MAAHYFGTEPNIVLHPCGHEQVKGVAADFAFVTGQGLEEVGEVGD